jgi:hypothetical protein
MSLADPNAVANALLKVRVVKAPLGRKWQVHFEHRRNDRALYFLIGTWPEAMSFALDPAIRAQALQDMENDARWEAKFR